MGSGVWFKNIISKKKGKGARSQANKKHPAHENGSKEQCTENECHLLDNSSISRSIENAAATRIQTAYRAYLVRKNFHQMRGMARLRNMVKCDFVKKQASNTLSHLHSWSRVQSQIRARRVNMVMESRLKQKKLENQMKLEAKLHDLEVEWSGGFETMDKALAKIHHREEAALKRERAMAYAFSNQWRANSNPSFGPSNQELSKEDWGWSWMDRWIAARPWETRSPAKESPKKTRNRQTGRKSISPLSKTPANAKLISPNGKATNKVRKLSYEGAGQKTVAQKLNTKAEEVKIKNEQRGS